MSVALNKELSVQINKHTYSEPKCAHGHARGAESLANCLWKTHLGRPIVYTNGATAKSSIQGKQGIIFFKDFFPRSGETESRGDHID
jgi:hypothetical protein